MSSNSRSGRHVRNGQRPEQIRTTSLRKSKPDCGAVPLQFVEPSLPTYLGFEPRTSCTADQRRTSRLRHGRSEKKLDSPPTRLSPVQTFGAERNRFCERRNWRSAKWGIATHSGIDKDKQRGPRISIGATRGTGMNEMAGICVRTRICDSPNSRSLNCRNSRVASASHATASQADKENSRQRTLREVQHTSRETGGELHSLADNSYTRISAVDSKYDTIFFLSNRRLEQLADGSSSVTNNWEPKSLVNIDEETALGTYFVPQPAAGAELLPSVNKENKHPIEDIFENFRNTCINAYELDPVWYLTGPELSWEAMLKMTKQPLDSLIYYLAYIDANNLYGWAMSQFYHMRIILLRRREAEAFEELREIVLGLVVGDRGGQILTDKYKLLTYFLKRSAPSLQGNSGALRRNLQETSSCRQSAENQGDVRPPRYGPPRRRPTSRHT
ncbi:hypothetical protein PR048_027912 [Dryococelus australis]|uniref:Uncharacterized protein n=1 Tax=Dryococelus australis TaxID=614101 RepID=A0ABQ9GHV3_9NEOP|nr:hypothetical protein PR048_027912 [Dryococelus australis]